MLDVQIPESGKPDILKIRMLMVGLNTRADFLFWPFEYWTKSVQFPMASGNWIICIQTEDHHFNSRHVPYSDPQCYDD